VGDVAQTTLDYTGQKKDGTGLLFYNARYHDPKLGRFLSPDSIVPGTASGQGGRAATLGQDAGAALRPLAVDFHEPVFCATLAREDAFTQAKGFWFQLSDQDRRQGEGAKWQWGPRNPQALDRYSYVLNNPLRYTDPTGHAQVDCDDVTCHIILTNNETRDVGTEVLAYGIAATLIAGILSPTGLPAVLVGVEAAALDALGGLIS